MPGPRIFATALLVLGITTGSLAQGGAPGRRAAPTRPPVFLSESWKALPTPQDDHGAWPLSEGAVASSNVQMTLHGTSTSELVLVGVRGSTDVYPLNVWTGTTTSPSAVSFRNRSSYVDLSHPLAKFRWVVRTSGFHQVRPIVKLADGTWLVGDHASGPSLDFNQADISVADMRWIRLDPERVVAVGEFLDAVDLSRVDEVGFADLMPGSGHGPGGYANIGLFEVHGTPVPR